MVEKSANHVYILPRCDIEAEDGTSSNQNNNLADCHTYIQGSGLQRLFITMWGSHVIVPLVPLHVCFLLFVSVNNVCYHSMHLLSCISLDFVMINFRYLLESKDIRRFAQNITI
jgi:hypothetical protein